MFEVSIHALLAECDTRFSLSFLLPTCFNPRTPCGVRLHHTINWNNCVPFQSTHSLRSATGALILLRYDTLFQSTHSLRSATMRLAGFCTCLPGFNPRTPCGVRRKSPNGILPFWKFQSTHSLRSATRRSFLHARHTGFQSTHSLRSATSDTDIQVAFTGVSIHALLAECDPAERPGISD